MKWTYDDEVLVGERTVDAAYIYLTPETVETSTTVDLQGAHVQLDIDEEGTVTGIEILGPAVHTRIADLGKYLKQDAETPHDR